MADLDDFLMSDAAPGEAPPVNDAPIQVERKSLPHEAVADAGLPANVDAEKTILGSILLDNQAFNDAAETLQADDFSLDSHRRVFLRMSELIDANHAVDIVTLANELTRQKEIESIGGVAYLASLTEGLPLRPVIEEYIRIVKDKSLLRRLMAICSSAIARAADQSESAMAVLEQAEEQLLSIAQEAVTGRLRTVADSVEVAGGIDPYLKPILNSEVKMGLQTGFYDLDSMTGGLHKGELIIVAARPSMGKTAFGINIASNCAIDYGAVVAFFSLEMSRQSLERRLLASIGRVDVRRATTGQFMSQRDKENVTSALKKLIESEHLYIDDTPALTPVQMRAKARRLKQRIGKLDLIVVDYLQLCTTGKKTENRRVEVGTVSRSLKAMAKELDVPVMALAQVARSSEQRSDKRPALADLRESGDIEADADIVEFIHRPSYYGVDEDADETQRNLAEILISKNREGPTGTVQLLYAAPFTCFMNLARG